MIPIHTLLHDSSYAGPSPRPLLNFCSRTKCESVGVQPRPILDIIFPWCKFLYSVDIDAELSQISLGQVDFLHELLVRLRNVVESKNAPAETEEEDGTEGDEGPEGKLDGLTKSQRGSSEKVFEFLPPQTSDVPRGESAAAPEEAAGSVPDRGRDRAIRIESARVPCTFGCGTVLQFHTEVTRRPQEMVCWARVMAVEGRTSARFLGCVCVTCSEGIGNGCY